MVSSETDHSDNSFSFSNFVVLHVKAHIQSFDRVVSKPLLVKITLSRSVCWSVLWGFCVAPYSLRSSLLHILLLYIFVYL